MLEIHDGDDLIPAVGEIVSKHFNVALIVLSYIVSYLGAMTTLEVLMRRTAMRGLYNWTLMVAAAISMGGISVWSMHFIGNYAILLGNGAHSLQIVYSPGFTAASFFLPIFGLLLAFYACGSDENVSYLRVIMGRTLAGSSICAMHYMGQAGIANYTCIYRVAFIIGSAIIAIGASIVALGFFFMFRSSWNAAWWKRGLAAAVLSSAVSGMHWLASAETNYRLKSSNPGADDISPSTAVSLVIAFAISGCIALLALVALAQAQRSRFAKKAKQLVLTTAVFDNHGRILVTADGLLPTKKITNAYHEQDVNDTFGVSHPAYHWMYRASFYWNAVAGFVPMMRMHLKAAGVAVNRVGPDMEDKLLKDTGSPVDDYLLIFRELFCVAAADLAREFNQPLQKLGNLYEDIVVTGLKDGKESKGKGYDSRQARYDVEKQALNNLGKGQLLFLTKIVDKSEADHLQAAGFRFCFPAKAAPLIAKSLMVGRNDLAVRLDMMRDYATGYQLRNPGVYVGLFAIRASIGSGFDVLSRKDARNLIPSKPLGYDELEPWQLDFISEMEKFTVTDCLQFLRKITMRPNASQRDKKFAGRFLTTLESLKDEINNFIFNEAIIIIKPIKAPCRGHPDDGPPGTAQLIVFDIIVPIHARAPGTKLAFNSLSFFKTQQQVYRNASEHAVFAEKVRREFARIIDMQETPEVLPLRRHAVTYKSVKSLMPEPSTFVDELFNICIRSREGFHV